MKHKFKFLLLFVLSVAIAAGMDSCKKDETDPKAPQWWSQKDDKKNLAEPEQPEEKKPADQNTYQSGIDLLDLKNGSPKYAEALTVFKNAAENGDDSAMFAAALLYEYGLGTEAKLDSAKWFYQKAAEKGNEVAIERVKNLSLDNAQNSIVLPQGTECKYNDILIQSDEGLTLVNGNATFEGHGASVLAMRGDGMPLYISFNNDGHQSNVLLDSKETAASMLIAVVPYVLNEKVDDQSFDKFKNEVKALPLTEQFAKKIDECIVAHGYLDFDVLSVDFEQAVDEFVDKLFADDGNIQSKSLRKSYDAIVGITTSKSLKDGDAGGGGSVSSDKPVLVMGNTEYEDKKVLQQDISFELKEAVYDDKKDSWNCKFTITNAAIYYVAINKIKLPATAETALDGIATYDILENIISPATPPDVLSLDGLWTCVSGTFEGLWDLVTKHELNDYYSPTKEFSMEFKSDFDAIAVTSFDYNHPQLFIYYVVKDLVFPLLKKVTEKLDEDLSNEYSTEAIKELVTRVILNEKVMKKVWNLQQIFDKGGSLDEVFYGFTELWNEMLDIFKDYLIELLKDRATGVWTIDASGKTVLTDKGLEFYSCVEKTFGDEWGSVFGHVTEVRDAAASKLSFWITVYKNSRKFYKMLTPLTGFCFKPFSVSLSHKSFATPAVTIKLELSPNSTVSLSDNLVLKGVGTNKEKVYCDVYVDEQKLNDKKLDYNFSMQMPTDKIGTHTVTVKWYLNNKFMDETTGSYIVNPNNNPTTPSTPTPTIPDLPGEDL